MKILSWIFANAEQANEIRVFSFELVRPTGGERAFEASLLMMYMNVRFQNTILPALRHLVE